MPPVGFEPTISVGERQKTYALDRAATGTDVIKLVTTTKYCAEPGKRSAHTLLSEDYKILLSLFDIAACLEMGGSLPSASSFGIS